MLLKSMLSIPLMMIALSSAGFIDYLFIKIMFPRFGGVFAGIMIGFYFKDRGILYSTFSGIFYIILHFIGLMAIGVGVNIHPKESLEMLLSTIGIRDIMRLISIVLFFSIGGWIGTILNKYLK